MTSITMEEYDLMKESKYRMYVAAVDKALKNFEYTSEWADLISALGKLNKVLLSYTKFQVIPRRIKISKRLAQCMHPALPSGVHLKALETYDIIFKCMGTDRLACELFIYSSGLFPLMSHAAMNIRPMLLTIYETHFVPLRARLRPALSGFLSGILPGLDTGTDHFDRTNKLLEDVCEGVDPHYFYTCIWQCVANNSPVRLPAVVYVYAHYSRKIPMEDQLYLMGHDIGLMVSGLCAAVQDANILVQRSALDLLMVCFPMQNKQLLYADMVRLVTAALSTILRRDMSLNRRLYSWLLETESKLPLVQIDGEQSDEFPSTQTHSIAYDLLNDAVKDILKKSSSNVPLDVKCYRLLTSLFEKSQIGPVILDGILYDVFRTLYLSCLSLQKYKNQTVRCVSFNGDLSSLKGNDGGLNKQFVSKNCQELVKNANLLFNTLQSYYIWSYIEKLYEEAAKNIKKFKYRDRCQVNEIGSGPPFVLELCILTDFLLDIIPIESYAESTSNILPSLFNKIIKSLTAHVSDLNHYEILKSLELCTKILTKIQPITMTQMQKKLEEEEEEEQRVANQLPEVQKSEETGGEEPGPRPIEKSKSDSKISENLNGFVDKHELTVEEGTRERSYSNQFPKKKEKTSPRIEKKSKNKKSKSSSKLYDLKNEETDSISSSQLSTPEDSFETSSKEGTPLALAPAKYENKHFLKCLEEYKRFFVSFVKHKILPGVDVKASFKKLVCDKDERTKLLQRLLDERLTNKQSEFTPVDYTKTLKRKKNGSYSLPIDSNSIYETCMSVACAILLEFCAFPNLTNHSENKVPNWLEALLVSACSRESSREIQLTAMSTLLEIFSLSKNQHYLKKYESEKNIIITGILDHRHVTFVEEDMIAIEEMSGILWALLGTVKNQNQLMVCVTLLYQIHNTFDTKMFVEQVIGRYLSRDIVDVNYIKQFCLLWHLGRDLNIKVPAHKQSCRNFDRSLLKILDMLENGEKPAVQLLAESFLTHSLLQNDICRILNPILLQLLASNTARVSIRHVNIQDGYVNCEQTDQGGQILEESQAKKIYAVSNVNGNVMYHMTESPPAKSPKKRWFAFSKSDKKYSSAINMTTSLNEDSNSIVTKKNKDFKGYDVSPNLEKPSKGNVKLIINPLSSKEIYPVGLDGSYARRSSHSSLDSYSSNDNTISNDDSIDRKVFDSLAAESGYDSLKHNNKQTEYINALVDNGKKALLESMEPISNGIRPGLLAKSHSFDEKITETTNTESSLVQSWSYCISDSANLHGELEFSKSAEDFFRGKYEEYDIVTGILNKIIDDVCSRVEQDQTTPQRPTELDLKTKINTSNSKNFVLYPIHSHMCLYYEMFDSGRIIYALRTLKRCVLCHPKLFIKCTATSGIKNLKNNEILYLLARHRKSLFGQGFGGEVGQEHLNFFRGYMFLDVVLSICMNYARTFFPFLAEFRREDVAGAAWKDETITEELENNIKIQLESLEILHIIVENLISIIEENNNKGFSSYIADLLVKCKIQKILLHCLLTSVRDFDSDMTFAEDILLFNNFQLCNAENRLGEHVEAFQIQLLRLIHSLIILEHLVFPSAKTSTGQTTPEVSSGSYINEHLNYKPLVLIPKQQIFLSAILSALRNDNMRGMHEKWLNMVTSCLPYFGNNLRQISISVIHQICNNIEDLASNYKNASLDESELSSDYAVTQLESLTILCHYCLLDASQTANQNVPPASTSTTPQMVNPGEILNNLVNVFFSPLSTDMNFSSKHTSDHYQNARKTILSHMPRIISSVAKLWQTVVGMENDYSSVYGNSKTVKQQLLEFLSPIAVHHGASFLAAVAVAWYERRSQLSIKAVLPEPNVGQNNLVYLISAIRVIPLDNLVQTVTAVIKNPPPCEGLSADICLDVSVLELFYCYMRNASATQLSEAWGSLLSLIREVNSLSASAQFLLAAILHEMMIKCCPLEERKDQKDLQDVTAKLIDCVSQVCGSCLEQTTWLRRNFAVREQEEDATPENSISSGVPSDFLLTSSHSVQAQLVLAEILSPILDICFGSSEKDKVNNILASLMCNIVPYLKTHTVKNMPSFNACSKLLSSLSSYQYTRKAWKKDVFDLLLDNALFQMDHSCLKYWRVIVDNLMTHDNTTFRDLMNRVSMTQSGTLGIFSSREQEYEQRAQLLKRLAYVIFCSEIDQYAKYMPEIQEQLTSSLRLNVPSIQAQVFMCFRVILIRMSPLHVTSLWPIIISEMLQVFLQIEQELSNDTEAFSSYIKLMSTLDSSWSTNSSNGLHALGHPHWLRLQLSTAKLLDLALLLPATTLPQFQMYRWAFVGDDLHPKSVPADLQGTSKISFTPHVVRIAEIMDRKFAQAESQIDILPMKRNELLLTMNSIGQLKDLHSFFKTLSSCSNRHRTECTRSVASDNLFADRQSDKKLDLILEKIDKVVEADFLDKIAR
ncbi:protein dopey-1 homolog [Anthonomus grandis grandis]|uniref:protein dopey-1 homolog n=1 Tax=Anthonomus grandis grandis TaxID=2921223 RepID=UPI00216662F7|nr:protein dopey-1 homolog [Anthonomus grandis grandis]